MGKCFVFNKRVNKLWQGRISLLNSRSIIRHIRRIGLMCSVMRGVTGWGIIIIISMARIIISMVKYLT